MQQFTVPQFIDVEDKIIGPITARQFIIMLAGFMLIVLFYRVLNFSTFLFFGVMTFGISGVIAFFKINGMPFHFFILNFIQTSKREALRVWSKDYAEEADADDSDDIVGDEFLSAPSKPYDVSRLTELALIVDTQGAYKGGYGGGSIESNKNFIIKEKQNKNGN